MVPLALCSMIWAALATIPAQSAQPDDESPAAEADKPRAVKPDADKPHAQTEEQPTPEEDKTYFFHLKARGNKFVYVVDISGSMTGRKFRRARNELFSSIKALDKKQKFYIIFFNRDADPMPSEGLLEATPANIGRMFHWAKKVKCAGDTDPMPALLMALDLQPDAIYLLTDGGFDAEVVDEVVKAEGETPIPINTIDFMDRSGERVLRDLAEKTGGSYGLIR